MGRLGEKFGAMNCATRCENDARTKSTLARALLGNAGE
jgi:hypothetical protein